MKNNISLKLAKEIHAVAREKGVKLIESEKSYIKGKNGAVALVGDLEYKIKNTISAMKKGTWCHFVGGTNWSYKQYPAYTTNELLEMLPKIVNKNGYELNLEISIHYDMSKKGRDVFHCAVRSRLVLAIVADTPAEALGLLYKELILKGIICE